MTTKVQQSPYLRQQRNFPSDDVQSLTVEVDRAYIDIAQKMNARIIGLFALNNSIVTGEKWFLNGQPNSQQTLRKVFEFTAAGSIPHEINFNSVSSFTRCFGSFTDGTNYYGAIYASNVAIAGQISFYITPTDIVILSGAGAPAVVQGTLVIEWLSTI